MKETMQIVQYCFKVSVTISMCIINFWEVILDEDLKFYEFLVHTIIMRIVIENSIFRLSKQSSICCVRNILLILVMISFI